MPTEPNNQPQNINDKKTTNVDRPKPRPIKRGSIILPITVLTKTKPNPAKPAVAKPWSTKAINTAGTAAIIEPILGMKLSKNANTAHNIKWSTSNAYNHTPINAPVPKLTKDLIAK